VRTREEQSLFAFVLDAKLNKWCSRKLKMAGTFVWCGDADVVKISVQILPMADVHVVYVVANIYSDFQFLL